MSGQDRTFTFVGIVSGLYVCEKLYKFWVGKDNDLKEQIRTLKLRVEDNERDISNLRDKLMNDGNIPSDDETLEGTGHPFMDMYVDYGRLNE